MTEAKDYNLHWFGKTGIESKHSVDNVECINLYVRACFPLYSSSIHLSIDQGKVKKRSGFETGLHEVQAGCELVLVSEVWDQHCAPHTAKGHKILTVSDYAYQEVLVSNLKSSRILKRLCKVLGSITPSPQLKRGC